VGDPAIRQDPPVYRTQTAEFTLLFYSVCRLCVVLRAVREMAATSSARPCHREVTGITVLVRISCFTASVLRQASWRERSV